MNSIKTNLPENCDFCLTMGYGASTCDKRIAIIAKKGPCG